MTVDSETTEVEVISTVCTEGDIRCDCNSAGALNQFKCVGGNWTDQGTACACEIYDIPCQLQSVLSSEAGICIEWAYSLAIIAGLGMLVFGMAMAGS